MNKWAPRFCLLFIIVLCCPLAATPPRWSAVRSHHVTSNGLMQHEINVRFHFHLRMKSGLAPRKRRHPPWAPAGASRTYQAVRTSRWERSGLLRGMVTIKKSGKAVPSGSKNGCMRFFTCETRKVCKHCWRDVGWCWSLMENASPYRSSKSLGTLPEMNLVWRNLWSIYGGHWNKNIFVNKTLSLWSCSYLWCPLMLYS